MKLAIAATAALLMTVPAWAGPRLFLVGTVPPEQRFARSQVTVAFRVTNDTATRVDVTLFAGSGGQVLLAGLAPDGSTRSAVLPVPRGVDGQQVSLFGVVQEQGGGALVAADRTLDIVADDVGPAGIAVTSPPFPAVGFSSPLLVAGRVWGSAGPEREGTVEVRAVALDRVIGAGAILVDGRFTAAVDLGLFARGSTNAISIRPFDAAGNAGTAFVGQLTFAPTGGGPGSVRLEALQLSPPAGSLTNIPAVAVAGRVQGERPVFRVDFLMDGFLESQLVGLASGEPFHHTMALPGDGTHSVQLKVTDAAGTVAQVSAGSVTLGRAPPGPQAAERAVRARHERRLWLERLRASE